MAFSELIALYLFLGGTAAGAFAVMSVLDLHASAALSRHAHPFSAHRGSAPSQTFAHHVSKLVYAASFFMLLVGLLCLLADLGKPQAFYFLFLYPTASFMSIGSFALALLLICMAMAFAFTRECCSKPLSLCPCGSRGGFPCCFYSRPYPAGVRWL